MTSCLVAERETPYGQAISREPIGSLEIFLRSARELPKGAWPRAELYILPARLYLDRPPQERPAPVFAYGRLGFAAECLGAGALDFLREPWDIAELEARARGRFALPLPIGTLWLDPRDQSLRSARGERRLSEPEYRVLRLFALAPDGLVTRAALAYSLWGEQRRGSRAADVLVSGLRRRLEGLGQPGELEIRALRRIGYRLLRRPCA